MNLFNPRGQKNLTIEINKQRSMPAAQLTDRSVEKLQSIMQDEGG